MQSRQDARLRRRGALLTDHSVQRRFGLVLFAVGLALYSVALAAALVADDLPLVARSLRGANVLNLPSEFTVTLLRPVIYASYRLDALIWGHWAPGFHLTNVLLHILASWILYRLIDLLSGRRLLAFWSALLFLASSVHSEAVTPVFGRPESMMASALFGASYAWARFRLIGGRAWMIAAYLLFFFALFAKEPAVGYIGVLVVLEGWLMLRETAIPLITRLRSSALRLIPFGVAAGVYFAIRHLWFGQTLGNYGGFEASSTRMLGNIRWFLLRTFVPGTIHNVALINSHLDQYAIAAAVVVLAVAAFRGRDRGLIVFSVLSLAITLFAVLPLSISIVSSESERFVYIPSAFGAVLTIVVLDFLLSRRTVVATAVLVLVLAHSVILTHQNLKWVAAGKYVRTTVNTMADEIEAAPGVDMAILMNLADSAHGVFLLRNGLNAAIELYRPELLKGPVLWAVTAHRIMSVTNPVFVTQLSPRGFRLDQPDGLFMGPVGGSWFYRITQQTTRTFDLEFNDTVHHWIVLYASEGVTRRAAIVDGPGLPFGGVDAGSEMPCDGANAVLTGWALDSDGVEKVMIETSPASATIDQWTAVADAAWVPGRTHPGVPDSLRAFPGGDRIGWSAQVPCPSAGDSSSGTRLRAIAVDRTGVRAELGQLLLKPHGR